MNRLVLKMKLVRDDDVDVKRTTCFCETVDLEEDRDEDVELQIRCTQR